MAQELSPPSFTTVYGARGTHRTADIVVIGGGATGAGVACDAALRGFNVVLVEQNELASGTSGHFHGMLHSGARYAVDDLETATECMKENKILRRVASPAVEDTGGLFLALSDEEGLYSEKLIAACHLAGIPIEEVPVAQAIKREPLIARTPQLMRVLQVPDGSVNGQKLVTINREAAERADTPATFLTHHKVLGFHRNLERIDAVVARDERTGSVATIECNYVINAAGVWANRVSNLSGIKIELIWNKGSMVVLQEKLSNTILNRCRPQGDGDILVPLGGRSIIGTTSVRTDDIDVPQVDQREIDTLIREGSQLVPRMEHAKIRAVFAGVRPLFGAGTIGQERKVSRSFRVIDHASDGADNFISVVGGKVTLYRRMAELAVDLVCKKERINRPSVTAKLELASTA